MRSIKSVLCILLIICLIVSLTACAKNERVYIALGDSVSSGYGLDDTEDSHVAIFYKMLLEEGYVDTYINKAVNGYTTTQVLELFENMGKDDLKLFKNAHVITLNIGGNNILAPFTKYLYDLDVATGTKSIKDGAGQFFTGGWGFIYGTVSGVGNLFTDDEKKNSSWLNDLLGGLRDMFDGTGKILGGGISAIFGIPDAVTTVTGYISPELKEELDKGVQTFSDEFAEIITWLEKKAPNATIIVNTVYNPVPQEILKLSLELSNVADYLIKAMNETIIEESEVKGFLVTDTYTHFTNLDLMKFNLSPSAGDLSLDVVHPNAEGHKRIAELNFESLKQYKD